MFNLPDTIQLKSDLTVSPQVVHQLVRPLLTPERVSKIQQVVDQRMFEPVVVLESLYDRGNISAVLRTAEALGFGQIHLIETQEKFKESQRTTAGSDKWLEIQKWRDSKSCIESLKKQGKKILVTHLDPKAKNLPEVSLDGPLALVFGNEKEGVSKEMIAAADDCVVFPMTGFVQSFNISVAAAICLSEVATQRKKIRSKYGDLSEDQKYLLQAHYYLRTQDSAVSVLERYLAGGAVS